MAKIKVLVDVDVKGEGEIKKTTSSLDEMGDSSKTAGTKLSSLKSAALPLAGILAAAGAAAVAFGKQSIAFANEQTRVETQLSAVIESTGMAAGLTSTELKSMASSLQEVTTFGDEAIIGGQNLLLTFTKIGKDVFPQATETMLDMSAALGQDMKTSAIQLGKALNDPIAGVSALTKTGVQFTAKQKDLIATLVESGDVAGAQAVILKELNTQFGGSAQAQVDTYQGKIQQLSNSYGDLQEAVGMAIQRNDSFIGSLQTVVSKATEFATIEGRLTEALELGIFTQEEFNEALKETELFGKSYDDVIREMTAGLEDFKIQQEKAKFENIAAAEAYQLATFNATALEQQLILVTDAMTEQAEVSGLVTERTDLFATVTGNITALMNSEEAQIVRLNDAFGGTISQTETATATVSTLFDGIASLPDTKEIRVNVSVSGFNAVAAFLGGGGVFGEVDYNPETGDVPTPSEQASGDEFDQSVGGGGTTIINNFDNADSPAQIAGQIANQLGGNIN